MKDAECLLLFILYHKNKKASLFASKNNLFVVKSLSHELTNLCYSRTHATQPTHELTLLTLLNLLTNPLTPSTYSTY
jgi:hypothetical protein